MFSPFRMTSLLKRSRPALAFAAGVACVVNAMLCGPADAQNVWNGSVDSDFYNGFNWTNGGVFAGQDIRIGSDPFTNAPIYTTSGVNPNALSIRGENSGMLTMQGGDLTVNGNFEIGDSATSGTGTFNMNGGTLTVTANFRTTSVSGGKATFNMSGGTINVLGSNTDNEVLLGGGNLGSNVPGTMTTGLITGGTLTSTGRIRWGRSNSDSTTAQNPQALFTMTGGLLWATGSSAPANDGRGTMNFQGGRIDLQGGILRATDVSSASGFNRNVANGNQGGLVFNGGVFEGITNLNEGNLWIIPPGTVDPFFDVTPVGIQRAASRMLGMAYGGAERAYTQLPNSTVRAYMSTDPGSGKLQANLFASNFGDYNLDGVVDQSDFNLWKSQEGFQYRVAVTATTSGDPFRYYGADGNGDGNVTIDDYNVWLARLGERTVKGIYAGAQDRTIEVAGGSQTQSDAGFASLNFVNTRSLTKTGVGELVLDGSNSYTYDTTVSAGTLRIANSGAFTLASSTVTVQPGATLKVDAGVTMMSPKVAIAGGTLDGTGATLTANVNSGIRELAIQSGNVVGQPGLTVSGTGFVSLPTNVRQTVEVSALTVDPSTGGKLDIGKGRINVAAGGISEEDLRADLLAGRGAGLFSVSGTGGIVTSGGVAGAASSPVVGYRVLTSGSAIVAWAAFGDTNLDGQVNQTDINLILAGGKFGQGTSSNANWVQGDFNYSGGVTQADINLLLGANLFGKGSYLPVAPASFGSTVAAVPEPGLGLVAAVAGFGAVAGAAVRRRTKRVRSRR